MVGQRIRRGVRFRQGRVASATAPRVPFLASDGRRAVIAALLSLIPGIALDELLIHLDFGPDELMADISLVMCSFLFRWVFFAGIYALLTVIVMVRADGDTFTGWLRDSAPRSRAARFFHSSTGGTLTVLTSYGSMMAVFSVLVLSLNPELRTAPLVVVAGVVAVAASWLLNVVSFAVHYARKDAAGPGLSFPGEDKAVFGDYFYLAAQVATSYSLGDVATLNRPIRRAVTRQSILSFLFNTVIIAVLVSVLISSGG
ncbi:MAG TPA: DUF1345 domain-containing protein [Thermomicrobiales bacterium]|nr:DUF1345 domain-containing protein [Thermomicrobiales bacterium]